jgi:hypothetical protein
MTHVSKTLDDHAIMVMGDPRACSNKLAADAVKTLPKLFAHIPEMQAKFEEEQLAELPWWKRWGRKLNKALHDGAYGQNL